LRQSVLTGFKTKGMAYRIVVTMFANDMTVYLTEKDNFSNLMAILTKWCKASGAKFNTTKTEIIPIGTETYCKHVLETRCLNDTSQHLPESINITKDRKATHIIGTWIGNGIDEQAIWSPIIKKIESSLDRWEKWCPTIEGRKIIIQCTIGSMTQYLTTAQGMPKEIELSLTK
ncbi:hypothetical protein BDR05DRAFT_896223, partial [Suillus weaverae]